MPSPRSQIYYWKCDRPAALHSVGQDTATRERPDLQPGLAAALQRYFGAPAQDLRPAGGQGNHATFRATLGGRDSFIRVEDGPERDDYFLVESHVLRLVREVGVLTPEVYGLDASRGTEPFAWQVLERVPHPDLNHWYKAGQLDLERTARQIGAAVARWQAITPAGFGPFRSDVVATSGQLLGHHARYADYFTLHLDRHLMFLVGRDFLSSDEATAIRSEINDRRALLDLPSGCLVHKDLALWNVLGTTTDVVSVIDWDDCIAGDPMDDLSLLGCFHDGPTLSATFAGYASVRPLPSDYCPRFWLHLLRNMVMKAVIRVGAGYFDLGSNFFLVGPGGTGGDLKQFTLSRIRTALAGLRDSRDPTTL
ncbi:phosphotransferase [Opitutus sp. ER46]|uniref:phosphotransferase family protein n=1 Tax=Opitutus sp. ER46 TaxID=2161864 RepID=UPI000D2F92BE|nr:phosphotransferase [Opitutus sp. ER46]PTX91526.1 hypothetical protein DB354_16715 [Opitutus sp. ER46]